jgi:hypothetical protein
MQQSKEWQCGVSHLQCTSERVGFCGSYRSQAKGEEHMTDRELMQQALEALELLAKYENPSTKIQVRKPKDGGPIVTMYPHKVATDAAAPLRERLAQPEQEPVYLHISPPKREWVGLTDQEINSVRHNRDWTAPWTNTTFARAIEAKLREKNGGEYRNGATTERTKLSQENT